jgi:hypothetical protein
MYFVLALVLQAHTPAPPPPARDLPVSLERIKRGLEKPSDVVVISGAPGIPPIFRMEVEEQRLDFERLWREDLPMPTYVRPSRGLTHHEFVGAVTPELFRGTVQHPCCNVLPAIEALGSAIARGSRKRAEARARREVRKALDEFKKAADRRDR